MTTKRIALYGLTLLLVLGIIFILAHAFIEDGKQVSEHTIFNPESPWTRGEPVSGLPESVFNGSIPISDPWVLRDGSKYRMWFTLVTNPHKSNQTLGIAEAVSEDGLTWQSTGQHVLAPDPMGWDAGGVETACVVRRPERGWLMYYTGVRPPAGGHHMSIGLATSDDGRNWTRLASGPLFEGEHEWEKPFHDNPGDPLIGGVLEPSVVYDRIAKLYRMWYAGLGRVKGVACFCIGYAESEEGLSWRRDAEPVFQPTKDGWENALVSHCHVVTGPDGLFHLFYFGSSLAQYAECEALGGCAMTPGAIGHAVSQDGRSWRLRWFW